MKFFLVPRVFTCIKEWVQLGNAIDICRGNAQKRNYSDEDHAGRSPSDKVRPGNQSGSQNPQFEVAVDEVCF